MRIDLEAPQLRFFAASLFLLLLLGLFLGGTQPVAVGLFSPPNDKLAHGGLFAILAILLSAAWPRLTWTGCFLLVTLIGFADEFHQISLPGRQAAWDDGLADMLGALLGLFAWRFSPWKKP